MHTPWEACPTLPLRLAPASQQLLLRLLLLLLLLLHLLLMGSASAGGGAGACVTARRVELVWSSGGAFPPERV